MAKIIITEDLTKALEVLKEAGIEARIDDALEYALECEAEYRLDCYLENDEDAKAKYEALSENEQAEIIDGISSRYNECGSQIFDYDYMDDIVSEEFLSILPTEEVDQ